MQKKLALGIRPRLAALLLCLGCVAAHAAEPRTPVVFLPGITGSKLRDRETGKTVWGTGARLVGPHDAGRALAVPLDGAPEQGGLEAYAIVDEVRLLGIFRSEIYSPLIRTLEEQGYVSGSLLDPRPEDTLLVFPYDWRLGNVETAQELARRLEALRRVRGDEVLHVSFVCHSDAARVARWYAKYGAATADQVEATAVPPGPPATVVVDRIVFVGTAQGGAVPTFTVLDHGRRYIPLVGRAFRAETMFTMQGLFDALPAPGADLFTGAEGEPVEADLFDPDAWPRHGWSIWGSAAERRIGPDDPLLGNEEDRRRTLAERLASARRLHRLLMQDAPGFGRTRYYQVQATEYRTASRIVLEQKPDGTWRTRTLSNSSVREDGFLISVVSAPGDRHATRASQRMLSPQEQAAVAGADFAISARHRKILTDPAALRRVVEYLQD